MNTATRVKRDPSMLTSRMGDELVLFSARQGIYYGAQEVGARIWELIQDEVSVASVCDQVVMEYSIDPETCERDVLEFLQHLEAEGLVRVC
ncbi:PqqD family peptide modification chaperone [Halomonas sp. HK25]|uniref:PqqD family peptide modification chaperone n=1 Tax=Halomonas sp. HK25 TaxID=3394321 RepID=UPI0039FD3369